MTAADNDPAERFADFGYESVPWDEKKARVRGVFDSVASRYDVMNDAMSAGLHRLWKRFRSRKRSLGRQSALDVAAGSGDLAVLFAGQSRRRSASSSRTSMPRCSRRAARGCSMPGSRAHRLRLADAESLPFADGRFHCVTIAFGLRNVTDKERALASLYGVLKPGGRLLVLEFSHAQLGTARAALRAVLVSSPAALRRMARRRRCELSLSRGVDSPPPGPRNVERHDGARGVRTVRVLQLDLRA